MTPRQSAAVGVGVAIAVCLIFWPLAVWGAAVPYWAGLYMAAIGFGLVAAIGAVTFPR